MSDYIDKTDSMKQLTPEQAKARFEKLHAADETPNVQIEGKKKLVTPTEQPTNKSNFKNVKDCTTSTTDNQAATPKLPDADYINANCDIRVVAEKYLTPAVKSGYVCPQCSNGTGSDGTGLDVWNNKLKCHKCGECFSVLDVILHHEHLDNRGRDFVAALKIACDIYGITYSDGNFHSKAKPTHNPHAETCAGKSEIPPEQLELIAVDIAISQSNLDNLPVEERRGLSLETLWNFHCGYFEGWTHPKNRLAGDKVKPSRRIIIPTSKRHYLAAMLKSDRTDANKKYWKQHAGNKEIFNVNALVKGIVVVVEGEIDCMSIWQATKGAVNVIATGGAATKIIQTLNEKFTANARLDFSFVVLFDNDATGIAKSKELKELLIENGYPATNAFLSTSEIKVDANDILINEGDAALEKRITDILKDAEMELAIMEERIIFDSKKANVVKSSPNNKNKRTSTFGIFDSTSSKVGSQERTGKPMEEKDLITTAQAAEILGVAPRTVASWRERKLFGVPFFTADEKKNGAWFYYRERVMQLKEIYQKGILQNMYKLARKFKGEEIRPFDICGTKVCIPSLSEIHVSYYPEDEAAKIIGVDRTALLRWRENGKFIEDMTDHNGLNWYAAERVEEMKGAYSSADDFEDVADETQTKLQDIKEKIADFEKTSKAAIEFLKTVTTFDSNTVFSDKVINAAAYAKLFDKLAFSNFARALKIYGDNHPTEKVSINDWRAAVKDAAENISTTRADLTAQLNKVQGAIDTDKFLADNPDFKFSIPDDFSVTNEGIFKIVGEKKFLACRRPVIIAAKTKSVTEKTFKPILQYWKVNGKTSTLPPMPASTVFNRSAIVQLTDYGLKTSSHTASLLVDYLDAFDALNEDKIPITCTVPRCGWYNFNDTDIFVDPRRANTITDDGAPCPLVVESSSQFATNLTTAGTLDAWIKAYSLAKKSPVARAIVAASISAPLLQVLSERNFLLYIKAKSLAGKTTALKLGAAAIGTEKIIRTFDATKNGFLGAAADVSDFSFLVDEKQSADNRLSEQLSLIVYALANGIGRTKLNADSTLKKTADWRTIAVLTGETDMLSDSDKEGAFNRLIQLNAPATILSADACKEIRRIIQDNYGWVMPLIIEKIFSYGKDRLRAAYENLQSIFSTAAQSISSEYRRYVAVWTLGDFILNTVLGVDEVTAYQDAVNCAKQIFKYVPTKDEIDATTREIDFVAGFIAQNQSRFIGGNVTLDKMQQFYGKIESTCVYITVAALKLACKENGYDYSKLVDDLISAGAFEPSDKILKGCKTPLKTHQKKIGTTNTNCFKFVNPADSEN